MWGSTSSPQDQESHFLPTEPARYPTVNFFNGQNFLQFYIFIKFFIKNFLQFYILKIAAVNVKKSFFCICVYLYKST